MAYTPYGARDNIHRRPSVATNPPVNHTRRSWSDNGVHFTVETASYLSPGFTFGVTNGGGASQLQGFSGGSMLGTALDVLGGVFATPAQQAPVRRSTVQNARQPYSNDFAYGEGGFENAQARTTHRPRSFISKVAERLLSNSQPARHTGRGRNAPSSADERAGRSRRPYRTEERRPTGTRSSVPERVDDNTDSEEEYTSSEDEVLPGPPPRRAHTTNDAALVEALENAAEHHRGQARYYRERLEQASRLPMSDTTILQGLLDELKRHERAHETATQNLSMARAGVSSRSSHQPASQRSRRAPPKTPEYESAGSFTAGDSNPFFATRRATHPGFSDFDEFAAFPFVGASGVFHNFFNAFEPTPPFFDDDFQHVFAMPGTLGGGYRKWPTFSTAYSGSQPPRRSATFPSPRTPPRNLLMTEEAQRLFTMYNGRWNGLSPADSNVPFPSRGLHPAALCATDSIWAPDVRSPISEWSEETVMQANAQAFFLRVVGLDPEYTETAGTGRVQMGYNRAQASTQQVTELKEMLKKERNRWHSDRLGRRNGGSSGPNEALQRDEKARAVFHAVVSLLEFAQ